MLTFLRKIRKSLIESGSTKRYLLYALGEIVLVVFGILIALQINNWNIDRINSIDEKRILGAIRAEITDLNWKTERGINTYTGVLEAADHLLFTINDPAAQLAEDALDQNISILTDRWLMGKGNSTTIYDALIGSGELGLISSRYIQNQLNLLKRNMVLLASYEDYQTAFIDDHLYPTLNRYIDALTLSNIATELKDQRYRYVPVQLDLSKHPSRFATDHKALLNNKEFANQLVQLMERSSTLLPIYWRIKDNISRIDSVLVDERL